ncbi:hypothetical protein M422DRAFT_33702 [Sphaerobolus stellatus SS14]|uniref:Cytochrome c oxidase assembly factor 3 n=1 Tax=Sphaerobolus stellatus (strain SS14) TaxID=990650 RepID=A0A0C9U3B9_SPHS4|nr:hypothetical protein M422DRAFT_33702 [Sphaerobolus stellatus SS14]
MSDLKSELKFEEFGDASSQRSTYRPNGYGMSPGLIRARRKFFLSNVLTGSAVAAFAVGVWAYSISAVKQDTFDDIDEEARALDAEVGSATLAVPLSTAQPKVPSSTTAPPHELATTPVNTISQPLSSRGIVYAALGSRIPSLFEPTRKTLVWTAPPLDRLGRLEDRIPIDNSWRRR